MYLSIFSKWRMRPRGPTRVFSSRMKETLGFSISAPPSRDSSFLSLYPSLPKLLKASNPLQRADKSSQFPWRINLVDSQAWAIGHSISSIFDLLQALIFSISCLKKVLHFRSTSSTRYPPFFQTTWTTQFQWRRNIELPSMGPVVVEERQSELVPQIAHLHLLWAAVLLVLPSTRQVSFFTFN